MTKVEKNEQTAKACLFVFRRLEGFMLNFKLLCGGGEVHCFFGTDVL
jgi:hypothetical protein